MTATISTARLDAMIRLELAATSIQKAERALAHPDLAGDEGSVAAPAMLKHLGEIHDTIARIDALLLSPASPRTATTAEPPHPGPRNSTPHPTTGEVFAVSAEREPVVAICGCRDRNGRLLAHLLEPPLWEAIEGNCIDCTRPYVQLCPTLRPEA